MIGRLKGQIVGRGTDWVLLNVSGVGYKVFVLPGVSEEMRNKETVFFTHLYVREDMMNLYGFLNEDQLELFELLISVSGIGPKAAMGVLSISDAKSIKQAIAEGRGDLLRGVSGIGRKMADRMILELKNRVQIDESYTLPKALTPQDEEVIQALVNLGYRKGEVSQVVVKISPELKTEERVKKALSLLGK